MSSIRIKTNQFVDTAPHFDEPLASYGVVGDQGAALGVTDGDSARVHHGGSALLLTVLLYWRTRGLLCLGAGGNKMDIVG